MSIYDLKKKKDRKKPYAQYAQPEKPHHIHIDFPLANQLLNHLCGDSLTHETCKICHTHAHSQGCIPQPLGSSLKHLLTTERKWLLI